MHKLIALNQNPDATDSIIARLVDLGALMDMSVAATLMRNITGQVVTYSVEPYLRAAVAYVLHTTRQEGADEIVLHVTNQCWNLHGAEGSHFFVFLKDVFDISRESANDTAMEAQCLSTMHRWAPGLLGYHDNSVSQAAEDLIQQKLFRFGPATVLGEAEDDQRRSRLMTLTGRHLAIACLTYLQDHYVARRVQAPRNVVAAFDRIIKRCEEYFQVEIEDNGLVAKFRQLLGGKQG